jgi:hypothetical protein
MNTKLPLEQIAAGAASMGGLAFSVTADQMKTLAAAVGEKTLVGRVGGVVPAPLRPQDRHAGRGPPGAVAAGDERRHRGRIGIGRQP